MKAYKAFKKDMTCRGFQFAEGETYELPEGQEAKLCERGFHACERPVDVLEYYRAGQAVVHEVEVEGVDPKSENDTKLCARKIHIGARMNIAQMVQATFEYNREHCTTEYTDPKQASAGYRGAASAGESGAASAGYRGAASAGSFGAAVSRGTAKVGPNGIACARGNECRVCGGLGAVLVIAEEKSNSYDIVAWKVVIVDGETVKADTWYTLKDGELVEASDIKEG